MLDLGAQEELDDNSWCCAKLRCFFQLRTLTVLDFGILLDGNLSSHAQIGPARFRSERTPKSKLARFWSEKCKVEHLSFTRHEKFSSNSSGAPRSSTKPDVRFFLPDVRFFCKKFLTRFITGRYGIPKMSDRVRVQEISMGDPPESPRHTKPSAKPGFSLLNSFWTDLESPYDNVYPLSRTSDQIFCHHFFFRTYILYVL